MDNIPTDGDRITGMTTMPIAKWDGAEWTGLAIDNLENKTIYMNDRLIAVRCKYCRHWVFDSDNECDGCGAPNEFIINLCNS